MSESSVLTLRLDPKLKKQLDQLSRAMNRTRSFLAAEAIREYLVLNEWQTREIKSGIAEADRGEFVKEEDVLRVVKKWTRRAG